MTYCFLKIPLFSVLVTNQTLKEENLDILFSFVSSSNEPNMELVMGFLGKSFCDYLFGIYFLSVGFQILL